MRKNTILSEDIGYNNCVRIMHMHGLPKPILTIKHAFKNR